MFLIAHFGNHFAEASEPTLAAVCYQHAASSQGRAQLARHEQLSSELLGRQANAPHGIDEPASLEP